MISARLFLGASLVFTLAFNVAWAWHTTWLSIIAAAVCTLIVPAGLTLWPQVPAETILRRIIRAIVMTGVCAAAIITSFSHSVSVLLAAGWTDWTACSVTGGAELLVALSTMAVHAPAAVEPVAGVDNGDVVSGAIVRLSAAASAASIVYRLLDESGVLLYVGVTAHLRNRLRDHSERKPWWQDVHSVDVQPFRYRADALRVENQIISQEHPLYNVNDKLMDDHVSIEQARRSDLLSGEPGPLAPRTVKPVRTLMSVRTRPVQQGQPKRTVPASDRSADIADLTRWTQELGKKPSEYAVRKRYRCRQTVAQQLLAELDNASDDEPEEATG